MQHHSIPSPQCIQNAIGFLKAVDPPRTRLLGLARAAALSGDVAKSRKAYQDFFALWKEADMDLPVFIEAKKEYDKLKQEPDVISGFFTPSCFFPGVQLIDAEDTPCRRRRLM